MTFPPTPMEDRIPVTTLEELDGLNEDEMVEGYVDGFKGEPEPGDNRSKAYWHGWRNGRSDRNHTSDAAQHELGRKIVARSRAPTPMRGSHDRE